MHLINEKLICRMVDCVACKFWIYLVGVNTKFTIWQGRHFVNLYYHSPNKFNLKFKITITWKPHNKVCNQERLYLSSIHTSFSPQGALLCCLHSSMDAASWHFKQRGPAPMTYPIKNIHAIKREYLQELLPYRFMLKRRGILCDINYI